MTDPGNPVDQQRRLAELQARRPKAKRRHPARASRIVVLGLSTTAMFGMVGKLGFDASTQTVTARGDTPTGQPATALTGQPADASVEATIDAELANATVVTAPPIRVTVPPVGSSDSSTNSSSGSSTAADPSSYQPAPVEIAVPTRTQTPVRTSGSN
jgi:hypothetical protein